jgi:hypothetical protein
MPPVPARVQARLTAATKRFQTVLAAARTRDVNESDTVTIVTDLISELFGFDKYSEVTSEHAIRGTFCDLAVSSEGKTCFLVETKAIGIELKDNHVKQAIDYAANKGIDWVVLTNGANWRIYRVLFSKPIDQELVAEFDFLTLDCKNDEHLLMLYLLTREGISKEALGGFHEQRQALSRFCVAATILSDPVISVIRRELKRLSPDVSIDQDQIRDVLTREVIKREVLEGEKAEEAKRKISKAASRALRARRDDSEIENTCAIAALGTAAVPNLPSVTPPPMAPPAA